MEYIYKNMLQDAYVSILIIVLGVHVGTKKENHMIHVLFLFFQLGRCMLYRLIKDGDKIPRANDD